MRVVAGILTLTGLTITPACSSDDQQTSRDSAGGSSAAGSTHRDCGKDRDCPGTKICLGGRCVEPLAHGDAGASECSKSEDCATGEVCEGGRCILPGSCTGEVDRAALEATYMLLNLEDGGSVEGEARDVARQCGVECLFSFETKPEQTACTHDCIIEEMGLSTACADCLVDSVECGRDNCLNECVGFDKALCFACTCGGNLYGVNCIEPYEVCSGIASMTCDLYGPDAG